MIFPFKSQTQTHIETNWTQKRKKKKMEIKVEWGREAMGEEDERGRGLCDSEIGDDEDERSLESREL